MSYRQKNILLPAYLGGISRFPNNASRAFFNYSLRKIHNQINSGSESLKQSNLRGRNRQANIEFRGCESLNKKFLPILQAGRCFNSTFEKVRTKRFNEHPDWVKSNQSNLFECGYYVTKNTYKLYSNLAKNDSDRKFICFSDKYQVYKTGLRSKLMHKILSNASSVIYYFEYIDIIKRIETILHNCCRYYATDKRFIKNGFGGDQKFPSYYYVPTGLCIKILVGVTVTKELIEEFALFLLTKDFVTELLIITDIKNIEFIESPVNSKYLKVFSLNITTTKND